MLQLPWHIDRPLALAVIMGVVSAAFVLFGYAYAHNRLHARDLLSGYFRRRFGQVSPELADRGARLFLLSMALLFGGMSAISSMVAAGVVQNGEGRKPPKSDDSSPLRQYLDSQNGQIDVNELIRQQKSEP